MGEVGLIDVYHGDGIIDWSRVEASGYAGALAKASEGVGEIDVYLKRNLTGMKAAGLVRGAYHFFRLEQDPLQQAAHFLNALRDAGYDFHTDLPPCLDLEDRPGAEVVGRTEVVSRVSTFLGHIEVYTGRRCILYVDRDYAENYVGDAFAGHPLWLAEYSSAPSPHLPCGWTNYAMWQHSQSGTVPGVPNAGNTDINRFNGTLEQLREWAKTGTVLF